MSYSFKNHIHNRKDYKMGGMTLNIVGENMSIEKDNVLVEIPLEKFDKLIKKMDGSVTYNKMQFKIPKKLQRESDILVHLKDPDGNTTISDPISSIHYNSEEHVHLIQHFENKQDFLSISVNFGGEKMNIYIQSELDLESKEQRFSDFNFSIEKGDEKGVEEMRKILKFYSKHTDNKIILYDIEAIENFLGKKIKGDYYDFKNDINFIEYMTDINGNINSIMPIENINLTFHLNNMYYEKIILNDEKELNGMKIVIKEKKQLLLDRTFTIDFKVGENLMINPSLFIKKNEEEIIKYFEKELSDFEPWDGDKVFWILELAIQKELVTVLDYIINRYCSREEDNDYLDYKMNLLFSCFLFNKYNFIPRLLKMYDKYQAEGFIEVSDDFSASKGSIVRNQYILHILGVKSIEEITFDYLAEHLLFEGFEIEDIDSFIRLL